MKINKSYKEQNKTADENVFLLWGLCFLRYIFFTRRLDFFKTSWLYSRRLDIFTRRLEIIYVIFFVVSIFLASLILIFVQSSICVLICTVHIKNRKIESRYTSTYYFYSLQKNWQLVLRFLSVAWRQLGANTSTYYFYSLQKNWQLGKICGFFLLLGASLAPKLSVSYSSFLYTPGG